MKYTEYDTFDFLKDEYFKSWALHPNEDADFFWKCFLENHPEKAKEIMEARALLLSVRFPAHDRRKLDTREKDALYEKILKSGSARIKGYQQKTVSGFNTAFSRVAAVVALAFAAAAVLYVFTSRVDDAQPAAAVQKITKTAAHGQKLTIYLDDSSVVKLNSGSSLTFGENFAENREVVLEGEAFFEVKRNPEKPFIVKSGSLRTTVLGTSFNVKRYNDDPQIEVAVLSGKVAVNVEEASAHVVLNPLEMVAFRPNDSVIVRQPVHYDRVFGWKDNRIYFENAGIDEIIRTLERWYGVSFEVNKTISKEKDFTGEYHNKTLKSILEGIGYSFNFNYKVENKKVTIY